MQHVQKYKKKIIIDELLLGKPPGVKYDDGEYNPPSYNPPTPPE